MGGNCRQKLVRWLFIYLKDLEIRQIFKLKSLKELEFCELGKSEGSKGKHWSFDWGIV